MHTLPGGDLGEPPSTLVVVDQELSISIAQGPEPGLDRALRDQRWHQPVAVALFGPLENLGRLGLSSFEHVEIRVATGSLTDLLAPDTVVEHVSRHLHQPGSQLDPRAPPLQMTERLEQRILDHVVGVVHVGTARRQAPHQVAPQCSDSLDELVDLRPRAHLLSDRSSLAHRELPSLLPDPLEAPLGSGTSGRHPLRRPMPFEHGRVVRRHNPEILEVVAVPGAPGTQGARVRGSRGLL